MGVNPWEVTGQGTCFMYCILNATKVSCTYIQLRNKNFESTLYILCSVLNEHESCIRPMMNTENQFIYKPFYYKIQHQMHWSVVSSKCMYVCDVITQMLMFYVREDNIYIYVHVVTKLDLQTATVYILKCSLKISFLCIFLTATLQNKPYHAT